jgi:benzoate/toluate 1,2-dioxygenase subunit alpha
MINNSRNLCLYPNVYLMDQFSSQIRVLRPISVDKTEVTIYCIAPKGESAEARARRIRQYEDFFNAPAWPPRTTSKNSAPARKASWARRRMERHVARCRALGRRVPMKKPDKIGLKPILSGIKTEDEGLYVAQHTYWLDADAQGHRRRRSQRLSNHRRATA